MSPRASLSASATLLAACLASSGAHAFCRGVTSTPPAGYDPGASGCFAPSGSGVFELYWKNLCTGYSLQQDASPLRHVTLDQATQIAAQAFARWSAASCSGGAPGITAHDEGPVACGLVEYDTSGPNQHVIVFRDRGWPYSDSSNTIGLTTITFDATDGEIFDADIEINSHDYALSTTPAAPYGSYDLAGVLTHEAGHFLGLAHSTNAGAVMYAHYRPGETILTPDDVQGVCSIYPHGGTRTTSAGALTGETCDATPRHGFTAQCMGADGGAGVQSGLVVDAAAPSTRAGCSVGRPERGSSRDVSCLALLGTTMAAVWLARRRARGRLPASGRTWAAVGCLAAALAVAARDAGASVSTAVSFDDLVRRSDAVATITPVEQHATWENGRIFTYTRVRVDRVIAGRVEPDPWVRTMGGVVGGVGQIVEGEPSFAPGETSLVFLRRRSGADGTSAASPQRGPHQVEVVARAQGQFALVPADDGLLRLAAARDVGMVLPEAIEPRAPLARDVLQGRPLPEAVNVIAGAWAARAPSPSKSGVTEP
jgi:hypothetical protein